MRIDILLFCPLRGNGGIATWAKDIVDNFGDDNYHIHTIDIAPRKDSKHFRGIDRWFYGIMAMVRAFWEMVIVLRNHPQIQVMHIATSMGLGSLRNYYLGRYCKNRGIKLIMHCHFGSIKAAYEDTGIRGRYFRKSLCLYDQVWVLTRQAADFLESLSGMWGKVILMPNSIEVPEICDFSPKTYKRIGFVGNLIPAKGIFELVEAVTGFDDETKLFIAGDGLKTNIDHIKELSGRKYGNSVQLLGWLPHKEAVKFIESLDILALPSYYSIEAFPISILEAMSRGKLVISCCHAAISDILTSSNGTSCGIMVKPKSTKSIAEAILWCQKHCIEADRICEEAYWKVKKAYSNEIIFDKYKFEYKKLISDK